MEMRSYRQKLNIQRFARTDDREKQVVEGCFNATWENKLLRAMIAQILKGHSIINNDDLGFERGISG